MGDSTNPGGQRPVLDRRSFLATSPAVGIAGCVGAEEPVTDVDPGTQTDVTPEQTAQPGPQVDDVVSLQDGDSLTEVLNGATEPTVVHLPRGEVTFDGPVRTEAPFAIVGHGSDLSTVRNAADELHRFVDEFDAHGADRLYRGFTLDHNFVPGSAKSFYIGHGGHVGKMILRDVRVTNLDMSQQSFSQGIIHCADSHIDRLIVDDCTFDLRPTRNIQPEPLWIMDSVSSQNATQEHVVVTDTTRVYGDLFRMQVGKQTQARCRGFKIQNEGYARVSGKFSRMSNYCCMISNRNSQARAIASGLATDGGNGDQWEIRGLGGSAEFHGTLVTDSNDLGDRGVIVKDAVEHIAFHDVVIKDTMVPVATRGGRTISGRVTCYNCGDFRGDDSHVGVLLRSPDLEVGTVNLEVNLFNEDSDRAMDPAIQLRDDGEGWSGGTVLLSGVVRGHEGTLIDDGTPDHVTVNTDRLFDDT